MFPVKLNCFVINKLSIIYLWHINCIYPVYSYNYFFKFTINRKIMFRKTIITITLIIFMAGCASTARDQRAAELINLGMTYANNGQYDFAMEKFNRAIKINPDCAKAYNDRGNVFFMRGEFDLAIREYIKAIDLDPSFAKAYSNLGFAHFEKKQYTKAIKHYTSAIKINPEYAKAYNNRGLVNYVSGNFDLALLDYNRAINLNPTLAKPYDNRGTVYLEIGDMEHACADFSKACELGECAIYEMFEDESFCAFTYLAMVDVE